MKLTSEDLERIHKWWKIQPHTLEPMHGWRSSQNQGGHCHCQCCFATIYRGDRVVGCYLKYVSVVFCPECVADNPVQFAEWIAPSPTKY